MSLQQGAADGDDILIAQANPQHHTSDPEAIVASSASQGLIATRIQEVEAGMAQLQEWKSRLLELQGMEEGELRLNKEFRELILGQEGDTDNHTTTG
jgi:hypothetical protein